MTNSTLLTLTPPLTLASEFTKFDVYPDAYVIERVWFYIVGIGGSLLGCVGLVCNCLSIGVILLHTDMRSCFRTLYMLSLAIYDSVFLVLNTIFHSAEFFHSGLTGSTDWFQALVVPAIPEVNFLLNVSLTGSAYTTIALSIDRWVGIRCPLRSKNVFTRKRVRCLLIGVFLWACVLNVPLITEHRLMWLTIPGRNNQTSQMFALSEYYLILFPKSPFMQTYLKYINPTFDAFLPVVAIAAINVMIGRTIRQRQRDIRSLSADDRRSEQASKDAVRIALQVVMISLFTLISRALRVTSMILIVENGGSATFTSCTLPCGIMAAISNLWNIFNATVNFFLYCYFGRKFRRCFMEIYRLCHCSPPNETAQLASPGCCCWDVTLNGASSSAYKLPRE